MKFSYDPEYVGEDVKALFSGAEAALVVAPFITKAGLLPLIDVLGPGGRLDVVTRWEPREIRAGASDPMIIDDVEATGGMVRLLPRLHAKVYRAGAHALVGSANPTGPGLGFTSPANIEVVVAAAATDGALARLLGLIDAVASITDRDYALQLLQYVATLPKTASMARSDHTGGAAHWIPYSMVPSRVMDCYFGHVERDDYRADLDAIDPPPDLSPEAFRTHVGLVLRQGLIGRIYRECEGLQQWPGIERMRKLLAGAGVEREENPPVIWGRILNWFEYYLETTESLYGGFNAKV